MSAKPNDTPVLSVESLREYFRELLSGAMTNQHALLAETTEFYLVELLSRFSEAESLYARRPDGTLEQEPLAFLLLRALEGGRVERAKALKRLGDSSLYVAGFFGDSLAGRLVDLDYYVSMGGAAYGTLATLSREGVPGSGAFSGLYEELCQKFVAIVDLFAEISERVSVSTNQGVVRVYERWVKTGSERLTRLLAEQGIIPGLAKPGLVQ